MQLSKITPAHTKPNRIAALNIMQQTLALSDTDPQKGKELNGEDKVKDCGICRGMMITQISNMVRTAEKDTAETLSIKRHLCNSTRSGAPLTDAFCYNWV